MWWKIRQWIAQHIAEHLPSYGVLAFLMIVGLAAGTATARTLATGTDPSWAMSALSSSYAGGWAAFGSALWLTLRFSFVLVLCTAGWAGAVPIALTAAIRGFISGFSLGLLVCALGLRGWVVVLIALLPSAALVNGAHLVASATAIELALISVRLGFRIRISQKLSAHLSGYLSILSMCLIELAVAAFEAGFVPLVFRWLAGSS